MKKYQVAVLGATGAVGQEMMTALAERRFPLARLLPLASARSAGGTVTFQGVPIRVEEATEDAFQGMDFVLGAADAGTARRFAPAIRKSGAVLIDNSSAFRLEEGVPLVVPEVNPETAARHRGIVANPNCSTIIAMTALGGVRRLTEIEQMTVCTYQAVSGAGRPGMEEMENQLAACMKGEQAAPRVFPKQILFNVIPWIGSAAENGYTNEEMKMQNEGRKILGLPGLKVCCTCVRVPVQRAHALALQFVTRSPMSRETLCAAIAQAPGCVLLGENDCPTPLEAAGTDRVYVGRLRPDGIHGDRGWTLWCCGDQLRKGAAVNAVQIMELLIQRP